MDIRMAVWFFSLEILARWFFVVKKKIIIIKYKEGASKLREFDKVANCFGNRIELQVIYLY